MFSLSQRIAQRFLHPTHSRLSTHWQACILTSISGIFAIGLVCLYQNPHHLAWALTVVLSLLAGMLAILLLRTSVFTTVAVMGLALGVAALFTVHAVAAGFEKEINRLFSGMQAHLTLRPEYRIQPLPSLGNDWLDKHPLVAAAAPTAAVGALILAPTGTTAGVVIKGIDPVQSPRVLALESWLVPDGGPSNVATRLSQQTPAPPALLGDALAHRLGLHKGDTFSLLLASQFVENNSMQDAKPFYVAGLIHSGFSAYDDIIVCISLAEPFLFPPLTRGIEFRLKDPDKAETVAAQLTQEFPGSSWSTWRQEQAQLLIRIEQGKSIFTIILYLIIVVACFNGIANLQILIKRKTPEIAMLQALGMNHNALRRILLWTTIRMTSYGIITGLILGGVFCVLLQKYRYVLNASIYQIQHLPVAFQAMDALWIATGTFLLCVGTAYGPIRRSTRLNPTEGLRHES